MQVIHCSCGKVPKNLSGGSFFTGQSGTDSQLFTGRRRAAADVVYYSSCKLFQCLRLLFYLLFKHTLQSCITEMMVEMIRPSAAALSSRQIGLDGVFCVFFSHHDALQDERPAEPLKVSPSVIRSDLSTPHSGAQSKQNIPEKVKSKDVLLKHFLGDSESHSYE